jgi:hypothetical protein
MSTYAELERQRKLARPFYLELKALGLGVRAREDPLSEVAAMTVEELRTHLSLAERHLDAIEGELDLEMLKDIGELSKREIDLPEPPPRGKPPWEVGLNGQ